MSGDLGLEPGWLARDLARAAQRVSEWHPTPSEKLMTIPDEVKEKMLTAMFEVMGRNPPGSDIDAMTAALTSAAESGWVMVETDLLGFLRSQFVAGADNADDPGVFHGSTNYSRQERGHRCYGCAAVGFSKWPDWKIKITHEPRCLAVRAEAIDLEPAIPTDTGAKT